MKVLAPLCLWGFTEKKDVLGALQCYNNGWEPEDISCPFRAEERRGGTRRDDQTDEEELMRRDVKDFRIKIAVVLM